MSYVDDSFENGRDKWKNMGTRSDGSIGVISVNFNPPKVLMAIPGAGTNPTNAIIQLREIFQTGGSPEDDTQTVCDGAKTVCVPALDFHTVCDGARQSLRQAGHLQETPRQSVTLRGSLQDRRDPETVCDAARKSSRPAMHLQETPRQSATISSPSEHLEETSRQSATVPDSLLNRWGTCMRLRDSVRRCQDRLSASRRLPDRESQTVFYGAKTVWSPAGYSKTVCDGSNTCRRLSKVFDGARQSLRPEVHLQETPSQSATVSRRCKNTNSRFPDCLRWCQTVSQIGGAPARDSHTFCDVLRPSGQLQETPRQSVTVSDGPSLRRRLLKNLMQVCGRSLHRRRLSWSLLQVPRRSGRLSDTV
ncbi:hypothetical protein DPMN_029216 [Dreissena polymorpha]|uniref:Uncharacterized protein n=1 Tax=Dreissena polymorpha TaxID=45954 RepID=A0A9D4RH64_DREPO|nr:hypothetical protein DPMN_029216 [Dreissena polymorpha]